MVGQSCQVESERLSYPRQNQLSIPAADCISLCELLGDAAHIDAESVTTCTRRFFILASIYVGRDHFMRQNMHEIISISNKVGYISTFLLITSSLPRPEIKIALLHNIIDQPGLPACVFHIKLRALMEFLNDMTEFGAVRSHVLVIEFQKSDLLQAHCIFFVICSTKGLCFT